MSSGRSVTIRASSLFRVSCVGDASTLSFCFPRSSSACSSSSSTEPYSWISFAAVFSPTPGTPGMLSDGSPFNATYSRYFDGGTPNRSSTPASSYRTMSEIPRRLNITWMPGRTSWKKSRSAVTITASIPCSAARTARVPIASSASWSTTRTIGNAKRVEHLVDQPELRREVGGGLGTAGLVVRVLLQPNGRPAQVERHRQEVGTLVAEQLDQHRREAVDGVRDLPGARRERRRKCEVRPVRERVPVQQEDPFAAVVRGGGRHAADCSRRRRRSCLGRIRCGDR